MRNTLLLSALFIAGPAALLASVDSELIGLIPPGTNLIAAIDVAHSQSSAFGQHFVNKIDQSDDQLQAFIAETGFDPRRDLQDVVFAASSPVNGREPSTFAILARGIFDANKIKGSAKSKNSVIRSYHGVDILVHGATNHQTGLAFPFADIAVYGNIATVEAVLALSGSHPAISAQWEQAINTAGKNDAWFASDGSVAMLTSHMGTDQQPLGQAKVLQSILVSSGGIHFGDTIQVCFDALTRSQQDAMALSDVVRFGASMVQMQGQKDAHAAILASALDSMNLTANGSSMHLSFSLPEAELERLMDSGPVQQSSTRH